MLLCVRYSLSLSLHLTCFPPSPSLTYVSFFLSYHTFALSLSLTLPAPFSWYSLHVPALFPSNVISSPASTPPSSPSCHYNTPLTSFRSSPPPFPSSLCVSFLPSFLYSLPSIPLSSIPFLNSFLPLLSPSSPAHPLLPSSHLPTSFLR